MVDYLKLFRKAGSSVSLGGEKKNNTTAYHQDFDYHTAQQDQAAGGANSLS